ncbi:MAG: alpha/beta fold hydrolase, partial [Bacteroidota bacterium]
MKHLKLLLPGMKILLLILVIVYLIICAWFYINQEKLLFLETKLPQAYTFPFQHPYEEVFVSSTDEARLHGLLFTADSARGVIYYLHGNGGDLSAWGEVAGLYTRLGFDVFMLDYRGYGKSEGTTQTEKQFFADAQAGYDYVKSRYQEDQIVVLGYSLGSAPASRLAADNHPRHLILQAPFYDIIDAARHIPHPVFKLTYLIPDFLFRFRLKNHEAVAKTQVPITLFHGEEDITVYP